MSSRSRRRPASLLCACAFAWLLTMTASAQVSDWPAAALDAQPAHDGLGLVGARTLSTNPAWLGLLGEAHGAYHYGGSATQGDLHGVYAAAPAFAGLALAGGAEWLTSPGQSPSADLLTRRYRLGAGARLGRFAFGARYNWLGSERDARLDTWGAWDAGALWRVWDEVVVSALVERLDTPRFGDAWLGPRTHLGLHWRGWRGRVSLDALYTLPTSAAQTYGQAHGVARVEPVDGWRLYVQAQGGDDPTRAGGGVAFTFPGGLSITGGALARLDGGLSWEGFTASLAVQAPAAPALWAPSGRWVALQVPGDLPERAPRSPFGVAGPALFDWLQLLDDLRADPSVDGVVLYIDGLAFGFAQLQELRAGVAAVRASGKSVVAHLRDTSTRSYFLACAAERIYLEPGRMLSARGISTTLTFYRAALDRLRVEPLFVKIDRYKSAPEAFLRDGPSAESEEQLGAYLDALSFITLQAISDARGLPLPQARALTDLMPMRPEEALRHGLIDGVTHRDALPATLQAALTLPAPPAITLGYAPPPLRLSAWDTTPRLALIYIDGTILDGPSLDTPFAQATGADTIERALDAVAASPDVVAVVVRVSSPGGSATGSEVIHRAIARLGERRPDVPVVVSMGDVAASGGYYVAAPAQVIFASPATLTGSIGIFSGKAHITGLLSWLGISRYTLRRGRFADLYSPDTPWDDAARAQMQATIEALYEVFIERVATGRRITPSDARALGGGRVWTGVAALRNGLIDRHGGLWDAVAFARQQAGLAPDAPVRYLHLPPRGPLSAFDGAIPRLPSIEALPAAITAFLQDAGTLSVSPLLATGQPLALLPFAWHLND